MPTTYHLPDDDVLRLLAEVKERYHRPLFEAGVRVGCLMASADGGPAVKHGGYAAYATIRVVPLKDRLTKQYDAELLLDAEEWDHLRHKQRRALLDHELSHLALADYRETEEEGDGGELVRGILFKRDDLGRPLLKLVKADWNTGDGFAAVIERHGEHAIEFANIRRSHTLATAARDGVKPSTQRLIDELHRHDATADTADDEGDR